MKKFVVLIVAVICTAPIAQGRPQSPTTGQSYDGVAPGGRALAMGLAQTASCVDSSAIYFNPAAIGQGSISLLGLTYEIARQSDLSYNDLFGSEMLQNKKLTFLCLASANGSFSWRPLTDFRHRIENGTDFQDNEVQVSAFTFSVSHKHNDKLFSGLNISYLSGRIGQSSILNGIPSVNISDGNGCSSDLGFLYQMSPELNLGLNLQNLLGFIWWDDYEMDQLPFVARAGLAFSAGKVLTFTADFEKRFYHDSAGTVDLSHVGIELALGPLAFRGGLYGTDLNDQQKTHYTAGLGFDQNKYRFSLAGEKYLVEGVDVFRYVVSLDIPI